MAQIPDDFTLKVYDENGLIFDKLVNAVSAVNEAGPLSILSGHTNFITTINGSLTEEMLIAHYQDGTTKGFLLESGVIKVYDNIVEVFLVLDLNLGINFDELNQEDA